MQEAIDAGKLPGASARLKRELAAYNAAFRAQHRDATRAARREPARRRRR